MAKCGDSDLQHVDGTSAFRRPLELQKVTILERDDESRWIEYRGTSPRNGQNVRVTHRSEYNGSRIARREEIID